MVQIKSFCDNCSNLGQEIPQHLTTFNEIPQHFTTFREGELWMTVKDLVKNFQTLEFCHLAANLVSDFHGKSNCKKTILLPKPVS